MSDSHGETHHHDTSHDPATAGKSMKRTVIVTLGMLFFAALTFIPPLLTRKVGDFFIAVWESMVIVAVFTSMFFIKKMLEADRSRDGEMKQAPMPTHEG